jgi:1,4-alpha-glucan branching enzyme
LAYIRHMSESTPQIVEIPGPELARIVAGTHHDPHAVLGPRATRGGAMHVLVFQPAAARVALEGALEAERIGDSDFFAWRGPAVALPSHYRVTWWDGHGQRHERVDPYCFGEPLVSDHDLYLLNAGRNVALWNSLGARPLVLDGVAGTAFAVWAPDAERVSVVGPFCRWDGRCLPMRSRGRSGVWELFVPGVAPGEPYKFEIRSRHGGPVFLKADPLARAAESRPATASVVAAPSAHAWNDAGWMQARAGRDWLHAPMSIYELHLGSWRRGADGGFMNYREIARELVPWIQSLGFTHVELLPVTEHPLDESWGYQVTGYFAPTARHGSADDLRFLVDELHRASIGVLLDWVPGHFPRDAHGLARFDGGATYEYADPRRGEHPEWGTLVFDYARHEVRAFLLSSALWWLEEFHFDGLRVDAVASMLYLDYGRPPGQFLPNAHGGRHNLEAIAFLRELNAIVHARCAGAVVIAEESTDWPLVSRPVHDGGLGFSMKWNMGWMHDTLAYLREDPLHRRHHHDRLTFGLMYAFAENFVLPLSHDEVVHLKRSLLGKMPGDRWQQLANLRLLYAWMWAHPGRKLLFMGGELAQLTEWDAAGSLPWSLLEDPGHRGVTTLVGDLNRVYRERPALHRLDFDAAGFEWVDCHDRDRSVLSFLRRDDAGAVALVVVNFTPVPRPGYRVGVPCGGTWREFLNTDSARYAGSNLGNLAEVQATAQPAHGHAHSLELVLPPLAAILLEPLSPPPSTS